MKTHSLTFNSIFNVIYKVLNILFPLITAAYIGRVITSELIGEVAYAQNIAQYFVLAASLGLPNYGTREISKKRDVVLDTNTTFTELFCLNAISTTCCLLMYVVLIFSVTSFRQNAVLYMITGLSILLNYINVDWVYQGFEQYKYIAIRSFIVKIASLAAILLFVKSTDDYLIYALISALAIAGNNVYNIFHLKRMGISLYFSDLDIKKHLIPVITLLCTTIAIELYTLVDTTMLGALCSKKNVAYYNYAIRITKSIIAVVAAIGGVLLPRLSYYKSKNDDAACVTIIEKTLNILVFLLLPSAVGLALCANEIIPFLYGKNFLDSIPILMISTLLIITLGFSNLFGTQILITYGKEWHLLIATILGAVSNMVLNWFLIKSYQGRGAAIASVISETIVTFITFFCARRCLDIKTSKKNFLSSTLGCVIMTAVILLLKQIVNDNVILLFGEIIMGICTYAAITLLTRNSVALAFSQKIKSFIWRL